MGTRKRGLSLSLTISLTFVIGEIVILKLEEEVMWKSNLKKSKKRSTRRGLVLTKGKIIESIHSGCVALCWYHLERQRLQGMCIVWGPPSFLPCSHFPSSPPQGEEEPQTESPRKQQKPKVSLRKPQKSFHFYNCFSLIAFWGVRGLAGPGLLADTKPALKR